MQQLHLVGFTTDRRGLIFSVRRGAKSGSYLVEVGEEVLAAIEEARARLAEEAAEAEAATVVPDRAERPQSNLAVREMQARLRRGQSVDQVAAKAGVDASWVARFAPPVMTEMAEVIRSVRARRYVKQRVGTSGATLGESVYRNLVDRGVSTPRDELDRGWSARQLADGQWEVRFRYVSRGRPVAVAWTFDDVTGKVTARDRLAGQLAFRPGGPPPAKRTKPAGAGAGAGAAAVAEAASDDPPRPAAAKAAAKRVATARRAARAQMMADAEKATKRNVAVARKAATRKPKPRPAPKPDPEVEELGQIVDGERDEHVDAPAVGGPEGIEGDGDHDDDAGDELDVVDDEEAVPAARPRRTVPGRRPAQSAPLLDPGPLDEEEAVDLDLAWLDDAIAVADDAPAPTSDAPPRRREPLRAARPPRARPEAVADVPTPPARPPRQNEDPAPRPRQRLRRAPRPAVDPGQGPVAGGPPVFRSDLARRAAEDGRAPEREPQPLRPRRRPLRPD